MSRASYSSSNSSSNTNNMSSTTRTSSTSSSSSSTHHRYSTAHSNSSAFSASANPNEDWTKISDLAERRRIQNRIAQRNYRKKLKRRLEDLEKKAASTESSPEPQTSPEASAQQQQQQPAPTSYTADIEAPQPITTTTSPSSSTSSIADSIIARPSSAASTHFYPASSSLDEAAIFTAQYRHSYTASPPIVSYPSSVESFSAYSPTQSYSYASPPPHFHHSPALSSAQSAVSSDGISSIKTEDFFDEDMSQFNLNYSPLDNQIGGQFLDCGYAYPPPLAHDPTIFTSSPQQPPQQQQQHQQHHQQHQPPQTQDTFDPSLVLSSFDDASLMGGAPDFWALYPDAPPYISV